MNTSVNIPPTPLPRVVIVGRGFGGVALAKSLGNTPYQVVLLDKRNYNTFTPLLYQVATAALEPDSVAPPLREILEKYPNLFFRLTEVTAVVPGQNTVQTTRGELTYDYLVIASGSRMNYYHIRGVAEYSMPLKTLPEAINIRSILLENVEKALTKEAGPCRESLLTVVVVGGGPTGVEMAGAIAELRQHEFAAGYREMAPNGMGVILLEKGPKLLAGMSDAASVQALEFLRGLGVEVRLHTGLAAYDGETARLEDGSALSTRCLLFTGGVDANPVPGLAEGAYGKANRIRVDEHLRVDGYANVFAIGDVAAVTSAAHPMLAQPAMQQGHYLGKYLKAKLGQQLADYLMAFDGEALRQVVARQRRAAAPALPHAALSGTETPGDEKGLIRLRAGDQGAHFIPEESPQTPSRGPVAGPARDRIPGLRHRVAGAGYLGGRVPGHQVRVPGCRRPALAQLWPAAAGAHQRRVLGLVVAGHAGPGLLRGAHREQRPDCQHPPGLVVAGAGQRGRAAGQPLPDGRH